MFNKIGFEDGENKYDITDQAGNVIVSNAKFINKGIKGTAMSTSIMKKLEQGIFLTNNKFDSNSVNDDYTISIDGVTSYSELIGTPIFVKFNVSNTGSATLNVNILGAKQIVRGKNTVLNTNDILVDQIGMLVFDGTYFQLLNQGMNLMKVPVKYFSTSAPVVSNNTSQGYNYGDFWVQSTTQNIYYYFGDNSDGAIWLNIYTSKKIYFYDDGTYGEGISNFNSVIDQSLSGGAASNSDTANTLGLVVTCSDSSKYPARNRFSNVAIDWTKFKKIYIKYKVDIVKNVQQTSQHYAQFCLFSAIDISYTTQKMYKDLVTDGVVRIAAIELSSMPSVAQGSSFPTSLFLTLFASTQNPSGSTGTSSTKITVYEMWGE